MPQDWIYYDTKDLGTAANTDIAFFANTEAGQGLAVTNMPNAGELPENETFIVEEIHLMFTPDIVTNDAAELMEEAMIEILINNNRVLIVPAILCGSPFTYNNAVEDMADTTVAGVATPAGGPYRLRKPIVIRGGVPFKVNFRTGTSTAGSGADGVIALRGMIERR